MNNKKINRQILMVFVRLVLSIVILLIFNEMSIFTSQQPIIRYVLIGLMTVLSILELIWLLAAKKFIPCRIYEDK